MDIVVWDHVGTLQKLLATKKVDLAQRSDELEAARKAGDSQREQQATVRFRETSLEVDALAYAGEVAGRCPPPFVASGRLAAQRFAGRRKTAKHGARRYDE